MTTPGPHPVTGRDRTRRAIAIVRVGLGRPGSGRLFIRRVDRWRLARRRRRPDRIRRNTGRHRIDGTRRGAHVADLVRAARAGPVRRVERRTRTLRSRQRHRRSRQLRPARADQFGVRSEWHGHRHRVRLPDGRRTVARGDPSLPHRRRSIDNQVLADVERRRARRRWSGRRHDRGFRRRRRSRPDSRSQRDRFPDASSPPPAPGPIVSSTESQPAG